MTNQENEMWAIVELFGHQRIAGKVTEQTFGGASLIRVDVPTVEDQPGFTRMFGSAAIYSVNPVSEEIARAAVSTMRTAPVQAYEFPKIAHRDQSDDDDVEW